MDMKNDHSGKCIVYAGIVTYDPDPERLLDNVRAVLPQVDKLIIVDNHSSNYDLLKKEIMHFPRIMLIENRDNYGIARALNRIMDISVSEGAEWVLALDQDSVITDSLVSDYLKYSADEKVGMMTCLYNDRNAASASELDGKGPCEIVDKCISSASFTRTSAWKISGRYDENMFIDFVDYDMCMCLRRHGFQILRINIVGMIHEMGHARDIDILWLHTAVDNHSPLRKYYIFRNWLYYIKKHRDLLDVGYEKKIIRHYVIRTLLLEKEKMQKARAFVRGWRDSEKMIRRYLLKDSPKVSK